MTFEQLFLDDPILTLKSFICPHPGLVNLLTAKAMGAERVCITGIEEKSSNTLI